MLFLLPIYGINRNLLSLSLHSNAPVVQHQLSQQHKAFASPFPRIGTGSSPSTAAEVQWVLPKATARVPNREFSQTSRPIWLWSLRSRSDRVRQLRSSSHLRKALSPKKRKKKKTKERKRTLRKSDFRFRSFRTWL